MSDEGQVVALAGLFQAARLVVDLAHEGRCDTPAMDSSLQSVLRIDASTPIAVFGGLEGVRLGLAVFGDAVEGNGAEASVTRITATVMHLERKLMRNPRMLEAVRSGIEAVARDLGRGALESEALAERLGALYGDTLSTLKPRVIVQGNGLQLSQPMVVASIRAALLAAVRAAVLWRQMGGSQLRLLFQRGRLAARAREMHASIANP
jgi:high frequency lysogenization protein